MKINSIIKISLVLCLQWLMFSAFAQDTGWSKHKPDTTKVTPTVSGFKKGGRDSLSATITPPDTIKKDSVALAATSDTTKKDSIVAKPSWLRETTNKYAALRFLKPRGDSLPDPKVAWRRAVIFPGWGQMYNHRYWKLPIVYGALGFFAYRAINYQLQYKDYRLAYQYAVDTIPSTVPAQVNAAFANKSDAGLKELRDAARDSRDQNALLFGLMYFLQVAEAFADAHLQGFDVSEDLSIKVTPTPLPQVAQNSFQVGAGVHIGIRF